MKKVIICDVISTGLTQVVGKPSTKQAIVTVSILGEEVTLPVTMKMYKEIYNSNKISLTIEMK